MENSSKEEDLAARMWAAINKGRPAAEASTILQTTGVELIASQSAPPKPSARTGEAAAEEVVWRPKGALDRTALTDKRVRKPEQAPGLSKQFMVPPQDQKWERQRQKQKEQEGSWHDLPVTPITDEVKRDLRLLRLRGALDPKRFYKKAERGRFPTRFAIGTVIEGPAEFYSGRLSKKQRKTSFTEELLSDQQLTASRKQRFEKLQEENSKWSRKKHKKPPGKRK